MTEHDLKTELRWMSQGSVNPRAAAAALERIEVLEARAERAEAEVARLREALREARDGLRYWVPQTERGFVERVRITEMVDAALKEAKP